MERYNKEILQRTVIQICHTLGWHSIKQSALEILVDVAHRYLREMCRKTHTYTELLNMTEPTVNHIALMMTDMHIKIPGLEEYLKWVREIPLPFNVPEKVPVPRESHLNFLKPGCSENITRPLHVPSYFPPMYPNLQDTIACPQSVTEPATSPSDEDTDSADESKLYDGDSYRSTSSLTHDFLSYKIRTDMPSNSQLSASQLIQISTPYSSTPKLSFSEQCRLAHNEIITSNFKPSQIAGTQADAHILENSAMFQSFIDAETEKSPKKCKLNVPSEVDITIEHVINKFRCDETASVNHSHHRFNNMNHDVSITATSSRYPSPSPHALRNVTFDDHLNDIEVIKERVSSEVDVKPIVSTKKSVTFNDTVISISPKPTNVRYSQNMQRKKMKLMNKLKKKKDLGVSPPLRPSILTNTINELHSIDISQVPISLEKCDGFVKDANKTNFSEADVTIRKEVVYPDLFVNSLGHFPVNSPAFLPLNPPSIPSLFPVNNGPFPFNSPGHIPMRIPSDITLVRTSSQATHNEDNLVRNPFRPSKEDVQLSAKAEKQRTSMKKIQKDIEQQRTRIDQMKQMIHHIPTQTGAKKHMKEIKKEKKKLHIMKKLQDKLKNQFERTERKKYKLYHKQALKDQMRARKEARRQTKYPCDDLKNDYSSANEAESIKSEPRDGKIELKPDEVLNSQGKIVKKRGRKKFKFAAVPNEKFEIVVKRKRGRPRKNFEAVVPGVKYLNKPDGRGRKIKKKRGRPKKRKEFKKVVFGKVSEDPDQVLVKRRPGRPRKIVEPEVTESCTTFEAQIQPDGSVVPIEASIMASQSLLSNDIQPAIELDGVISNQNENDSVAPAPEKRKRGRPPRVQNNIYQVQVPYTNVIESYDAQIQLDVDGVKLPEKKKRGRPRKYKLEAVNTEVDTKVEKIDKDPVSENETEEFHELPGENNFSHSDLNSSHENDRGDDENDFKPDEDYETKKLKLMDRILNYYSNC